jgi:phosphate-selective porin OprO/OprP
MKYTRHFFLSLLAAALTLSAADAQDVSDPLADLRARVDRLEHENIELRQSVLERLPDVDGGERAISFNEFEYLPGDAAAPAAKAASDKPVDGFNEVGKDLAMTAKWNNGLELSTKDKAYRIHLGGRYQMDAGWYDVDSNVQATLPGGIIYHDGVDPRRARLRADGTIHETFEFAIEFDFVNSVRVARPAPATPFDQTLTAPTDLWIQFSKTPLGNIRIGNQKEAIGFEHLVSSRYLPFMERSFNQDTFYGGGFNGFTPGISFWDLYAEDHGTWNIGLYKPVNNVFASSINDGDYAITGRLTRLLQYEDEGRQLWHVGGSLSHRTTYDEFIQYRTRSPIRSGLSSQWPTPANITVFGDTLEWANFELVGVHGPWTFQSEYLANFLHNASFGAATADTLFYQGAYAQLFYFLTGESDNYSLERGAFDRVKPFANAFWVNTDGGSCFNRGAWQVGARYNWLDLNDQGINGGQLHDLTAGLNWFLNPNSKLQFNYFTTYRDAPLAADDGWINGWGMRYAIDF